MHNRLSHLIGMLFLVAACTVPNPNYRPRNGDAGGDGGPPAFCDPQKPFGAPTLVPGVNSSQDEGGFSTTRDDLTGFVSVSTATGPSDSRITITQREARTSDFAAPQPGAAAVIDAVAGMEGRPSPVGDGLVLYFERLIAGQTSHLVASRADSQSAYGGDTQLMLDFAPLEHALSAKISSDGQTLYWFDDGPDFKVHAARRSVNAASFMNQHTVSTMRVGEIAISADELTLYYAGGTGNDIYVTTRANTSTAFEPGIPVDGINSPQFDTPSFISHDGCTLYFVSNRSGGLGGFDIWQARKP